MASSRAWTCKQAFPSVPLLCRAVLLQCFDRGQFGSDPDGRVVLTVEMTPETALGKALQPTGIPIDNLVNNSEAAEIGC